MRGRSGEFVADTGKGDDCLSENIEPTLDATLPRLPSPPPPSFLRTATPPGFRSGLRLGLDPRRGLKTSFILPTGEGDRFWDPFVGARSDLSNSDGADSEVARTSTFAGNVEARGVGAPSTWASARLGSGRVVECMRGEEVVRYPMCDGCVDNVGGVSRGL